MNNGSGSLSYRFVDISSELPKLTLGDSFARTPRDLQGLLTTKKYKGLLWDLAYMWEGARNIDQELNWQVERAGTCTQQTLGRTTHIATFHVSVWWREKNHEPAERFLFKGGIEVSRLDTAHALQYLPARAIVPDQNMAYVLRPPKELTLFRGELVGRILADLFKRTYLPRLGACSLLPRNAQWPGPLEQPHPSLSELFSW